jgi:hypothetical protein
MINIPEEFIGKILEKYPDCSVDKEHLLAAHTTMRVGGKAALAIFPKSAEDIDRLAFRGCKNISSITVEEGNAKYHSAGNCLIETATKTLVIGCKTSVIPSDGSVTVIGSYAFERVDIKSIVLPEGITEIQVRAFSDSSLIEINIPASVVKIRNYAFYDCPLWKVTFADTKGWINDAHGRVYVPLRNFAKPQTAADMFKDPFRGTPLGGSLSHGNFTKDTE